MKPVEGERHSPSLEEGQPPPKRKKTVTWAGDVPTSSAEQERPQQLAQEPAVVVLQQQESDSLFAGLDESLLEQQVNLPPTATAALSREALLQHRIDDLDRLYQLYQEEAWSLYEELHLRHHQFADKQQQQQQQDVTSEALGEQQQQQEQQAGAMLDVRQLATSLAERRQPIAQSAERLEAGKQQQGGEGSAAAQSGAAEQQEQQPVPSSQGEAGAAAGDSAQNDGQQRQQQQEQPQQQPQQEVAATGQAAGIPSQQQQQQEQLQQQGQQAPGVGQAAAEPQAVAEAGGGKEGECQAGLPPFEEMEAALLSLGPGAAPVPPERLLAQRSSFVKHLGLIGRLEQSCLGALCRELDAFGAVAALCSRNRRYLLRRTAVMLGRSTESQGKVDVDLSGEGHSQTVSRQQAQLVLEADGTFWLRCLGRRAVLVNGKRLEQGSAAPLPHLSLVKLGGVGLLFVANHGAVRRAVRRSAAMVL